MPNTDSTEAGAPPTGSASGFAAPVPGIGQLFAGFSSVGLSGFGGVLPFARRMLVDQRKWLSATEFNELLGVCQFLPGPNVVNLAVCVGARHHGVRGALAAVLGLLGGPVLVVLALALLYDRYGELPQVQGALRGIAAAGAGLLIATGLRMGKAVKEPSLFLPFALAILLMLGLLRWPMLPVMLGLLVPSCALAFWHVRRVGRAAGGK